MTGVRLLVVDPDLGDALAEEDQFVQARDRVVFPDLELPPGPLDLEALRSAAGLRGRLLGVFVIDGSLTINIRMSGRTSTRLIGARELVLLDGVERDSIPVRWFWQVPKYLRLALIDERLHAYAREWPQVLNAIMERAAQQTRNGFLQQAISQLPRVEDRLLALFWSVADRQGTVRRDGVWFELPVTHDGLAHMVGAQRPTVSLGLARLGEVGFVRVQDGGFLLAPDSRHALSREPEPQPDRAVSGADGAVGAVGAVGGE